MKLPVELSISVKIRIGFFTLVGLILINGILTIYILNGSIKLDDKVTNVFYPSLREVSELELFITNSKEHCERWVQEIHEEDRQIFIAKLDTVYPKLKGDLIRLSGQWENQEEVDRFNKIMDSTHLILTQMQQVVSINLSLDRIDELYGAVVVVNDEIKPRTENLLKEIRGLSNDLEGSIGGIAQTKIDSFEMLEISIYVFIGFLIVFGLLMSTGTEKAIVDPINKLKFAIDILRKGEIPDLVTDISRDEVGEISKSLNRLIVAREDTARFAQEIGMENFEAEYQMLSENDSLGKSLIDMRDNLKLSKEELESKNKKIVESINYAQHIQNAILPTDEIIRKYFPESFIYYVPRDVVSGDFPWMYVKGEEVYIAVVDCTGHGVPGALLSFVGYFTLNEILGENKWTTPAGILDELNTRINRTLRQKQEGRKVRDGMDVGLCKINLKKKQLEYAGAYRPLYYLRGEQATRIKGNSMPIGRVHHSNELKYDNHQIDIMEGDRIYIFSDGMPDQFGGEFPDENQYMSGRIKKMAQIHHDKNMADLKEIFKQDFEQFMGNTNQTDDVLLIGIKF